MQPTLTLDDVKAVLNIKGFQEKQGNLEGREG